MFSSVLPPSVRASGASLSDRLWRALGAFARHRLLFGLPLLFVFPAHAQVSYVRDIPLPDVHDFLLPSTAVAPSGHYYLVTPKSVHDLDYDTGTLREHIFNTSPSLRANSTSLVTENGIHFYYTGFQNRLYALNVNENTATSVAFSGATPNLSTGTHNSMVASGSSVLILADNQLYQTNPSTGATVGLLTGAAASAVFSNPGSMALGPNGLLYVLDQPGGNYRVQSFNLGSGLADADRLVGSFNVGASLSSVTNGMAISQTGHLYLGDGLGGGLAYNTVGDCLGAFSFTGGGTPDPSGLGGGANFLNIDGLGNVFVYTPATGLHQYYDASGSAIPEPSDYAAILGAGALALAMWRRRKA
jgi:hypothetical protein